MHNFLKAALDYAQRGLSVIPIRPDKKAYLPWTEYQRRRATPEEIRAWAKKWPGAMVGIITGPLSGLFVVDCDNEDAYRKIQELLPDSFISCIAKTPRGYHLYLVYPKGQTIGNTTGIMPGVDIRGEGGYCIAPPSINAEGKPYSWLPGLALGEVALAAIPDALYKSFSFSLYALGGCGGKPQETTKMFENGRRDNDLFHVANVLTKGGGKTEEIEQVLEILAKNCKPPFPLNEIPAKIQSAIQRNSRRFGDVTKSIEEWVSVTDGYFSVTDCHKALQGVTDSGQTTFRGILHRLAKRGIIEKHGVKDGVYRRIDNEIDFMDFANADIENTIDLSLPLGLHNKTKLFPKAVILVAGVSGMGKTLFSFNTIADNFGKFPIYYFNSEMGAEALKHKLSHFPIPISEWEKHMKVIDNWSFNNISDKIQPDAFNVIDYLEPEGERPYNIHGVISAIIRRLNRGTALITIQKKPNTTMGTGGIYSIKAATLAVALDWCKIEIVKNRFREADMMPSLNKINFEIHQGYKFALQGSWYK